MEDKRFFNIYIFTTQQRLFDKAVMSLCWGCNYDSFDFLIIKNFRHRQAGFNPCILFPEIF